MFSLTFSYQIDPEIEQEQTLMAQIPSSFSMRPATEDDLQTLVGLFNDYWHALTGIVKFSLDQFQSIFSVPGFDLDNSMIVILSPEEEIIASGLVMDLGTPPIHPSFFGCVHPDFEGQGLGQYLLTWGAQRASQAIDRCPKNARVSLYIQTSPSHEPSVKLLDKAGLQPIRYSWIMMTELNGSPPKPAWPENIHIRTFKGLDELEIVLKVTDEAFADHWGHVDRSGDPERIKRFRHQVENDADFDPGLWFLAMDGDEVAGVALCSSTLGTDPTIGEVDTLGVRRPWRRQGLGLALLHHSFGEFHRRSYKGVALGVDTQNLSGATHLYQKAGMEATREFVVYEQELRPGDELSKQE